MEFIDENDPTWRLVRRHIEERLAVRRRTLETEGLDLQTTEGCRHAISELKLILTLPRPGSIAPLAD